MDIIAGFLFIGAVVGLVIWAMTAGQDAADNADRKLMQRRLRNIGYDPKAVRKVTYVHMGNGQIVGKERRE